MRYILKYSKFLESVNIDTQNPDFKFSDILESLTVFHDNLMDSIKAEEVDVINTLKFEKDSNDLSSIDRLVDDPKFIESLSNIGLKKSDVQNTDDYQTFISKSMKFVSIFDIEANDLMNPKFILIQTYNDTLKKWNEIKLFKVNDDIKKFYDKLSSKTIEIKLNDDNFIYKTSNSGNNWELQNLDNENETFKRFLNRGQLQELIKMKGIKLTII